jgi:spore coat polysaccharide biosynthesis protein SpsF (cytidylyltransferase family)
MRTVAIVQARLGSSRLPGKALADVCGEPLLGRVLTRAKAIPGIHGVVVATTTLARDDAICEAASAYGADSFRGSESDVLDRYYGAARKAEAAVVVRITADCPLLDPEVSGQVVAALGDGSADYASNIHPPSFPDGLDTEAIRFEALERAWLQATRPADREHVTPYIWRNPGSFRLVNLGGGNDLSAHRWTVDYLDDLEFVRAVYSRMGNGTFGLSDVLQLLAEDPDVAALETGHSRNEAYAQFQEGGGVWPA